MNPEPAQRRAAEEEAQAARAAEERFLRDLAERGEVVPEGTELPPGATHETQVDAEGHQTVHRRRFSLQ